MKNYHYVYKIINNNPSDERQYYIGVRTAKGCTPDKDTEYWGSSKYLKESINEIGLENFSKEILSIWNTREEAVAEEIRLHTQFDVSKNPEFYNKSKQTTTGFDTGGVILENHWLKTADEKTKKEWSKKLKEIHPDFSGENHPRYGQKLSNDTKIKISNTIKESGSSKGKNNGMAKKIAIYNVDDKLITIAYGNFEQVCMELNLPYHLMMLSYKNNGKKIYNGKRYETRARNMGYSHCLGWYAKEVD